ncbi:MAG: methyltransferase domain-containing protein [Betaproteobacteria bacterium]
MSKLTFTGERFIPTCAGEIAYEHWHRYAFAKGMVDGKRVLDAACGEGYGSALLAHTAASVVGVDIDAATIAHARTRYRDTRLSFVEGSCTALPLPDGAVDVVVSFETIEHLPEADQPAMLAEFARVLAPDGVLVISSPNRELYSDARHYVNEFHLHELYRDGLSRLLETAFGAQRWFHQRVATWSGIWAESREAESRAAEKHRAGDDGAESGAEAWLGGSDGVVPYTPGDGMYFIVVAAKTPAALPAATVRVSLLADVEDSEGQRAAANAGEVLRLDALLNQAHAALDRQSAHVLHLETLVAERDRAVDALGKRANEATQALAAARYQVTEARAERDQARAALVSETTRLNAAVRELERSVSNRQSLRWWLALPWLRLRRLFGGPPL